MRNSDAGGVSAGARFAAPKDGKKSGGPRYLVAYCSIMTLLLAFFIVLQSFISERQEGTFMAGKRSFVRALRTFGLSGVLPSGTQSVDSEASGPRYLSTEGQDEPPSTRRIDPELEAGQQALQELEDQLDVQEVQWSSRGVVFSTPFRFGPGKTNLTAAEEAFLKGFARRIAPALLSRGCVIGFSALVCSPDRLEAQSMSSALAAARQVREKLLQHMTPAARKKAAGRLYCYAQRIRPEEGEERLQSGEMKIDILVTKIPPAKTQRLQEAQDR